MQDDKIYLDKKGYEQLLQEIEQLKQQIYNNGRSKTEAYESAVGDGWHDNFAFEEATREEYRLKGLLRDMQARLARVVIIDKLEDKDEDVIDIGDTVRLKIRFGNDDPEIMLFRLVASDLEENDPEITVVTINSPIGKALYQKRIGETGSYKVGNNTVTFVIVSRDQADDLDDAPRGIK